MRGVDGQFGGGVGGESQCDGDNTGMLLGADFLEQDLAGALMAITRLSHDQVQAVLDGLTDSERARTEDLVIASAVYDNAHLVFALLQSIGVEKNEAIDAVVRGHVIRVLLDRLDSSVVATQNPWQEYLQEEPQLGKTYAAVPARMRRLAA